MRGPGLHVKEHVKMQYLVTKVAKDFQTGRLGRRQSDRGSERPRGGGGGGGVPSPWYFVYQNCFFFFCIINVIIMGRLCEVTLH